MPYRAGLDREAVVRAAAELADGHGLEAISLAAVAERLGVRTPTLYHYVDGLPGLKRELALRATRELGARMGHAVMGKAGADALLALATAYRAFVKEHPGIYAASVRSSLLENDAELQAAQGEATEIVFRALDSYHLDANEAVDVARALRSMVHGFATLEAANGFGIPQDVDASFEKAINMVLEGIPAVKSR
jgi:AcrR family transcriptional regulator